MSMVRRASLLGIIAALVFALGVARPLEAHAWGQAPPGPSMTFGRTATTRAAFFGGPAGIAIGIGIMGATAYEWYYDCSLLAGTCFDNGAVEPGEMLYAEYNHTNAHLVATRPDENSDWTIQGQGRNCIESTRHMFVTHVGASGNWSTANNAALQRSDSPVAPGQWLGFAGTRGSLGVFDVRMAAGFSSNVPDTFCASGNHWTTPEFGTPPPAPEHAPSTVTTQRRMQAEAECVDVNGLPTIVTESGPVGGADAGSWVAPEVMCPPNHALRTLRHTLEPEDGLGESVEVFWWEQDDDVLTDTQLEPCMFVPSPGEGCELQLQRRLTVQDPWEDCDEFAGNCTNWWQHANKLNLFRCLWGPIVLDLDQCWSLARFYETGTPWQGVLTPNPELVPSTTPQTQPITTTPSQPQPDPTTVPHPSPGPQPGPGTGTVTLPSPQPGPEHGDTSCWSGMEIGWNPVSWVLEPVKCALQWAFVPSQATVTQAQALGQQTTTKAPFSYLAPIPGIADTLRSGGQQCFVIDVTMPSGWLGDRAPGAQHIHILDSCSNEALVARLQQLRPLLLALAYLSLFMPIAWWAWRTYAPASTSSA